MNTQKSTELFNQALDFLDKGEFEKGLHKLDLALISARSEDDMITLIPALVCAADLHMQLDAFDEAQALLDEIFTLEKAMPASSLEDDALLAKEIANAHVIHNMLLCRRLFNKALDLLEAEQLEAGEYAMQQTIVLSQQKGNYEILLAALICMADMLIQLGRKAEARLFLEQALTHEKTGQALSVQPAYKDVFEDNFARAHELLSLL